MRVDAYVILRCEMSATDVHDPLLNNEVITLCLTLKQVATILIDGHTRINLDQQVSNMTYIVFRNIVKEMATSVLTLLNCLPSVAVNI